MKKKLSGSLRSKRATALKALLRSKRLSMRKLADMLDQDTDQCQQIYGRIRSYMSRNLLPVELAIRIAKALDVPAPGLYIQLTKREQKRLRAVSVPAEPTPPAAAVSVPSPGKVCEQPVTVTIPELGIKDLAVPQYRIVKRGQGHAVVLEVPVSAEVLLDRLL